MSKLAFIPDDRLIAAVGGLLDTARKARIESEKKFGKNVIDPFGAMFEMAGFGVGEKEWLEGEKNRQAQKSLQNHIGTFHQRVLGSFPGWEKLNEGMDIVNPSLKIVAEVKNKYNTVKGESMSALYDKMADAILPKGMMYKGFTAYYVEVIPKASERYDVEFTPSDAKTGQNRAANPLIRRIDGYSFYEKASGTPDAMLHLFNALPDIIAEYFKSKGTRYSLPDRAFALGFFNAAFSADKEL